MLASGANSVVDEALFARGTGPRHVVAVRADIREQIARLQHFNNPVMDVASHQSACVSPSGW